MIDYSENYVRLSEKKQKRKYHDDEWGSKEDFKHNKKDKKKQQKEQRERKRSIE